jgi:hypothetical protein
MSVVHKDLAPLKRSGKPCLPAALERDGISDQFEAQLASDGFRCAHEGFERRAAVLGVGRPIAMLLPRTTLQA